LPYYTLSTWVQPADILLYKYLMTQSLLCYPEIITPPSKNRQNSKKEYTERLLEEYMEKVWTLWNGKT